MMAASGFWVKSKLKRLGVAAQRRAAPQTTATSSTTAKTSR